MNICGGSFEEQRVWNVVLWRLWDLLSATFHHVYSTKVSDLIQIINFIYCVEYEYHVGVK
jgi:hypothetical protein